MAEIKHIDSETVVMTLNHLDVSGELLIQPWGGGKATYPMNSMRIDLEVGRELLKDYKKFSNYLLENAKESFGAEKILGGFAMIKGIYTISSNHNNVATTEIIFTTISFGNLSDEEVDLIANNFYGRD